MKRADKIRAGLQKAAKQRAEADRAYKKATADLRLLLRDAQTVDDLTMSEAAKLAGISRVAAYEMLRD